MSIVTFLFVLVVLAIPINSLGVKNLAGSILQILGVRSTRAGELEIILAGDVMLGRTVMTKSLDTGNVGYPFENIAAYFARGDLAFVNLENPITEGCRRHYDGLIFCATPDMLMGLTRSGIDIVNLANNHTLNYGKSGLDETRSHLKNAGIDHTGFGSVVTRKINGTSVGFLGFDFLSQAPTEDDYSLIADTNAKVDILIVGVHWGEEYTPRPRDDQREWARKMVSSGADAIAGHHPHWVQEMEYINDVPVFYSLGNLVFDQMWSDRTRRGLVVKLVFQDGKLVNEERRETFMENWAQPMFVKN